MVGVQQECKNTPSVGTVTRRREWNNMNGKMAFFGYCSLMMIFSPLPVSSIR